jgi:DMSO/TMAO reductase YedYZ molybdopterin-dependent catalytic subunit
MDRRRFLQLTPGALALAAAARPLTAAAQSASQAAAQTATGAPGMAQLPFANGARELVAYPGKRPLIRHVARPPVLETPFSVFDQGLYTPNDAFFVRYHLSGVPTEIDPAKYRIAVGGHVDTPLTLSLDDLKHLATPVDIVAVNQCSGNSRGFFTPRANGGQLGHGAMGNARWTGVPLKAVLDKAGVKAGAVQVSIDGLDTAPLPTTPDFVKALDIDQARDGEVMLAWAMNGEDLPMLNGYPVRLIVPGYYGTYWVKHVSQLTVLDKKFDGFWMSSAYRIPDNACHCIEPGTTAAKTRPIGRFSIRSLITNLRDGQPLPANRPVTVRGLAFDGGYGITEVQVSADEGRSWRGATLGEDLGKYSFRGWTFELTPPQAGSYRLQCRAFNRLGETQPREPLWNTPGYMLNTIETVEVSVA